MTARRFVSVVALAACCAGVGPMACNSDEPPLPDSGVGSGFDGSADSTISVPDVGAGDTMVGADTTQPDVTSADHHVVDARGDAHPDAGTDGHARADGAPDATGDVRHDAPGDGRSTDAPRSDAPNSDASLSDASRADGAADSGTCGQAAGQACCGTSCFGPNLLCSGDSLCEGCGGPGQPCCHAQTECVSGGCCVSGVCTSAGSVCPLPNSGLCEMSSCGGACPDAGCGLCGAAGENCCAAGCTGSLTTCANGKVCTACGGGGEPCCGSGDGGTFCASGTLRCTAGLCR